MVVLKALSHITKKAEDVDVMAYLLLVCFITVEVIFPVANFTVQKLETWVNLNTNLFNYIWCFANIWMLCQLIVN